MAHAEFPRGPRAAPGPAVGADLVVRTLGEPPGLRIAGEVSLRTHPAWEGALASLPAGGSEVHLELSALTFVDVFGATTLALAAQRLGAGRRLVVDRPPPSLRRVLETFWSDLAAIEVTV
ncbi:MULTISPECIES: STAS domain-containing protein [Streptomyces]|uniref:STAS domain-containing protein n=1 Tax=Streptomyces luteosporeus TaxID=173856 RepID=A0ABP6GPA7_9ACTN